VDQLGTWNGWERFCPKPFLGKQNEPPYFSHQGKVSSAVRTHSFNPPSILYAKRWINNSIFRRFLQNICSLCWQCHSSPTQTLSRQFSLWQLFCPCDNCWMVRVGMSILPKDPLRWHIWYCCVTQTSKSMCGTLFLRSLSYSRQDMLWLFHNLLLLDTWWMRCDANTWTTSILQWFLAIGDGCNGGFVKNKWHSWISAKDCWYWWRSMEENRTLRDYRVLIEVEGSNRKWCKIMHCSCSTRKRTH
jgi:hypothetical protein